MEKVPFIVYAEFECILKNSESTSGNTQITQIHQPCSIHGEKNTVTFSRHI